MSPVLVLLIAFVTWVAWIPATLLQKRVRGEPGGISIFPVPLFPLVAWAAALVCQRASLPLGPPIIAGVHAVLLIVLLLSIARSLVQLKHAG